MSLLTDAEQFGLGLAAEAELAAAAGLDFHRLATADRRVPGHADGLALATRPCSHLAQGASVAIHCRHGIGRSSTLAALVLVLEGADPRQASEMISAARGKIVPDTAAETPTVTPGPPIAGRRIWLSALGTG